MASKKNIPKQEIEISHSNFMKYEENEDKVSTVEKKASDQQIQLIQIDTLGV